MTKSDKSLQVFILALLFFLPSLFVIIDVDKRAFYWFYLTQFIIFFVINHQKGSWSTFFSPSGICISYLTLSFFLGGFAFEGGSVLNKSYIYDYSRWDHFLLSSLFFTFCINVLILCNYRAISVTKGGHSVLEIKRGASFEKYIAKHYSFFLMLICLPFFFVSFDLSLLGASGDLSVIPRAIFGLSLILFVQLFRIGVTARWVVYFLILIIFSILSVDSKREAIFLLIPIFTIELANGYFEINIKTILKLALLATFGLALILIMSVARGYGGYVEDGSFISSIKYLVPYIQSEYFIAMLFNNLEVNYTFFHSYQAMEYIINNPELYLYGESLIKPLFIFIPRELIGFKPDSFVHVYTSIYDPEFRMIGGSWPPNFLAELYWNLSVLSVFILYFIFLCFDYIYFSSMRYVLKLHYFYSVMSLYFLYLFLGVVRGAGLDSLFTYLAVSLPFIVLPKLLVDVLNEKKTSNISK